MAVRFHVDLACTCGESTLGIAMTVEPGADAVFACPKCEEAFALRCVRLQSQIETLPPPAPSTKIPS